MDLREQAGLAIDEIVENRHPSSRGKWFNIKPSGPTWQMEESLWAIMLGEICTNYNARITPCALKEGVDLDGAFKEHLHKLWSKLEDNTVCPTRQSGGIREA